MFSIPTTKRTLICAMALSAAGALPFNIFPLFLGSFADQFTLNNEQLGLVGSSYLAGSALVAVTAYYWLSRVRWKSALLAAIGVILMCIYAFGVLKTPNALFLTMLVYGGAHCVLFTVALTVLSRQADVSRAFGLKLTAEMLLASLVIITMTMLILSRFGYAGFLIGLAVTYSVIAISAVSLPENSTTREQALADAAPHRRLLSGGTLVWFASAALFVQFAMMSGVWGFLERIGGAFDLSSELVGAVLSASLVTGLLAGLGSAVVGERFGVVNALIAALTAVAVALFCFLLGGGAISYAIGTLLFAASLQLFAVYQMALITALDKDETFVTLIPLILATGGAIGPWLSGELAADGQFYRVFLIGIALTFLVALTNLIIGRYQAKTPATAQEC